MSSSAFLMTIRKDSDWAKNVLLLPKKFLKNTVCHPYCNVQQQKPPLNFFSVTTTNSNDRPLYFRKALHEPSKERARKQRITKAEEHLKTNHLRPSPCSNFMYVETEDPRGNISKRDIR